MTVRPVLIFPEIVRVTLFVETAVERTLKVSPSVNTVKSLAAAVAEAKFSEKVIGIVVPVEGIDAETTVGADASRGRVDEFVTAKFVNESASIPDWFWMALFVVAELGVGAV